MEKIKGGVNDIFAEWDRINNKKAQACFEELRQIDLSEDGLRKLSSEEVANLNERMGGLRAFIKEYERYNSHERKDETNLHPEIFQMSLEQLIEYVKGLNPEQKGLVEERMNIIRLAEDLGKKLTQHYKENKWEEIFQEEIQARNTSYGDAGTVLIDYYKEKGINLENPTQQDIDRFFELRKYHPSAIENEMLDIIRKDKGDDAMIAFNVVSHAGQTSEFDKSAPYGVRMIDEAEQKKRLEKIKAIVSSS